jgi:hypothetical protein
MDRIPDEAIVVRGGRNRPDPSGVTGVSVECEVGLSIEELAVAIPHKQIGTTTVREVRKAGGDVIYTSGRSPNHATLVPRFLTTFFQETCIPYTVSFYGKVMPKTLCNFG